MTKPTLERRILPGLGREASAIGAGCWTIGGPAINRCTPIGWDGTNDEESYKALVTAHEAGITYFDTADVYGMGHSERLLGKLLEQVERHDVVISSKLGYFAGTAAHPYVPRQMRHQLGTSLDNLATDHLDIAFFHSDNFGEHDRYLPGAIAEMDQFRKEGLIRAVGMRAPHEFAQEWAEEGQSPCSAEATRFLHLFDLIRPEVLIVRHNLFSPHYAFNETDIFGFAAQRGVGVVIKQALAQGLILLDRSSTEERAFSEADHRHGDPRFSRDTRRVLYKALTPIRERFGATRADLARVALRYALQRDPQAVVLTGFRDADQITTNATCLGDPLTPGEISQLRSLIDPAREVLKAAERKRRPRGRPPA